MSSVRGDMGSKAKKTRDISTPLNDDPSQIKPPKDARRIGPHSYMYWQLVYDLDTSHYNGSLPQELENVLPHRIGDIGLIPAEQRQIYEEAVRSFKLRLEDVYHVVVVGPYEEIWGSEQIGKKPPKRIGRPSGMNEVNRFIADYAIDAHGKYQVAWSELADILINELQNKPSLNELEQNALNKLLDLKSRRTKRRMGDFLKQTVERRRQKI